jgi:phage gpG-like protein
MGKAVMAGLFQLEAHAKLNVRKNFKQRTGDLASRWETVLDHSSDENAEGHTAPLVVYARIQELGGVIKSTSGRGLFFQTDDGMWHNVQAVTIPARPYLRPAADENKDDIFSAVGNVLRDVLETGRQ